MRSAVAPPGLFEAGQVVVQSASLVASTLYASNIPFLGPLQRDLHSGLSGGIDRMIEGPPPTVSFAMQSEKAKKRLRYAGDQPSDKRGWFAVRRVSKWASDTTFSRTLM